MLVNFTELRPDGDRKKHAWWFDSLEASLDVLSGLTAKGRQIVQVEIVDQEQRLWLPVELFDGTSFRLPLHQLEDQWTRILTSTPQPRCSQRVDMKSV